MRQLDARNATAVLLESQDAREEYPFPTTNETLKQQCDSADDCVTGRWQQWSNIDYSLPTIQCVGVSPPVDSAMAFDITFDGPGGHTEDCDEPTVLREARKAKRQAQNRAAQRAFRDRKENRLRNLDAEISDLKSQLKYSKGKITELKAALSNAQTQIDTLKSIIPSIMKPVAPEVKPAFDLVSDQEALTAMMNFQWSRMPQNVAAGGTRETSLSSPNSCHSDDISLKSL